MATARRFVDEGAYVFINGRREAELLSAAKDIGKNVKALKGDVSNLGELDRIAAQIKENKSKLDIVFANAGIAKYATLGEITEELYDVLFNNAGVSSSSGEVPTTVEEMSANAVAFIKALGLRCCVYRNVVRIDLVTESHNHPARWSRCHPFFSIC